MESTFNLNISFFILKKWIVETNEINIIAIINFKFLFHGGMFDLADYCKKSCDTNNAWQ